MATAAAAAPPRELHTPLNEPEEQHLHDRRHSHDAAGPSHPSAAAESAQPATRQRNSGGRGSPGAAAVRRAGMRGDAPQAPWQADAAAKSLFSQQQQARQRQLQREEKQQRQEQQQRQRHAREVEVGEQSPELQEYLSRRRGAAAAAAAAAGEGSGLELDAAAAAAEAEAAARQLTRSIMAAGSWEEVQALYSAHEGVLSHIHVAAMLQRLVALYVHRQAARPLRRHEVQEFQELTHVLVSG